MCQVCFLVTHAPHPKPSRVSLAIPCELQLWNCSLGSHTCDCLSSRILELALRVNAYLLPLFPQMSFALFCSQAGLESLCVAQASLKLTLLLPWAPQS